MRDLENGQCLMQDLYGRVWSKFIQSLKNFFHAFDTRPPVQERMEEEMKKKLFRIFGIVLISLVTLIILLSLVGTVAEATGGLMIQLEPEIFIPNIHSGNYQLDFFVDSSWDWLLGIGVMAREERNVWTLCHY